MTDKDVSATFGHNAPDSHTHMRAAVGECVARINAVREMNMDPQYGRDHVKIPTVDNDVRNIASDNCLLMLQTAQMILAANKTQPLHGASNIDVSALQRYADGGVVSDAEVHEMRVNLPLGMRSIFHSNDMDVIQADTDNLAL